MLTHGFTTLVLRYWNQCKGEEEGDDESKEPADKQAGRKIENNRYKEDRRRESRLPLID